MTIQRPTLPPEEKFENVLGARLVEAEPIDGYWCYELRDQSGLQLLLSVNIVEASIQTTLSFEGQIAQRTSAEGLRAVEISTTPLGGVFIADCASSDSRTRIEIVRSDRLTIQWGTLVG